MDPDANLKEQLEIIARIIARGETGSYTEAERDEQVADAERLADLVEALDGWIKGGGFPPAAWRQQ